MSSIPFLQNASYNLMEKYHLLALQQMEDVLGYYVTRDSSNIGGTGVFARSLDPSRLYPATPLIEKGQIVGLYPGLLYTPFQPLLLQSICNRFIFRCLDGIHIDGNSKRLSRMMFRSCLERDRVGSYLIADDSWLTAFPLNPLNIGQYVNNQSKNFESNVAYHELTIHSGTFPLEARRFLPNLWYSLAGNSSAAQSPLKLVALVATKNIGHNQELFSDYFTLVS